MKVRILILAAGGLLMSSCGGGPKGGGPTSVRFLSPSTRPDLSSNGFLLPDDKILGCTEFTSSGAKLAPPPKDEEKPDPPPAHEHAEPPIGGEDGSFTLFMNVNENIAGTTNSRKKLCGQTDKVDNSHWLHWRRWSAQGKVIATPVKGSDSTDEMLEISAGQKVVVALSDGKSTVEIFQETDGFGTVWTATTNAKFGDLFAGGKALASGIGVNSYLELDVVGAKDIRMSKIEVMTGGSVNHTIALAEKDVASCTGFVICHTKDHCKIPEPKKCVTTGTGTPRGQGGNVH